MSALVRKAVWYGNRLAAMSAPEILHRVREVTKRQTGRRLTLVSGEDYGDLPCIPGLREAIEKWDIPVALMASWEKIAQQIQAGEFFLLSHRWPKSSSGRWHMDPVTGVDWPQDLYCFDIDYRHQTGRGDIKYVWELNRLQYLQVIAALALKKNDMGLAKFCLNEIENWIDSNPPYRGVNWASGIELSLRMVSILVVVSLLDRRIPSRLRLKIWDMLRTHALWIERYPSRYSSANNHQAAEGLGLFLIGALCPQLPQAECWKEQGWEILCAVARQQIFPDGVGAEQAIAYTAVLAEMLLLGLHVARAANMPIPEDYTSRLMAAGEYLRWFTDSAGHQPRIGDDDEACVIGFRQSGENYVSSILGCIAAVFNRADLVPPDHQPRFRNGFFGFPPDAVSGPVGLRCFEQGGYTVGRHRIKNHEVFLAMDHGPLGYLSIAAHGHADALSVWLHIDGQPVFVDAGTYLYHSGGAWRRYFRDTAAHNTLCLENTGSSCMAGPFNWSSKAKARIVSNRFDPEQWHVEAEHGGYLKKFGARHRRRLSVKTDEGFTVEDWITGRQSRRVAINFLLHPSLTATMEDGNIIIYKDRKVLLRLEYAGPLVSDIRKDGWYSPAFGQKESTTRLVFYGRMEPEQKSIMRFLFG